MKTACNNLNNTSKSILLTSLIIFAFFLPLNTYSQPDEKYLLPVTNNQIKIVSYNAENLFDTKHDIEGSVNKNDWAYLPSDHPGKTAACEAIRSKKRRSECLSINWTPKKLTDKLERIKRTIKAQGSLPDLLGVVEIENENVAQMLADKLGYKKFLITQSPDRRGIDVALFYNEDKLNLIDHKEISVRPKPNFKTRNILAANFSVKGYNQSKVLGVFVNHWPSQFSPTFFRGFAAKTLKKAIRSQEKRFKSSNYHTVAMGDFNSITDDYPHPIYHELTNPIEKNHLLDVQNLIHRKKTAVQKRMPMASYFYAPTMTWNRLDRFVISQNLNNDSGMNVEIKSFRIIAPSFITKVKSISQRNKDLHHFGSKISGTPKRYNFIPLRKSPKEIGYSDHFPIAMILSF